MINQQDLQASLQSAQAENTAREMLNRGAPIENVIQATGLDRNTVENIFIKDRTMGAPNNPMPNPVAPAAELSSGIMSNPVTDMGSQRFIEGVMQGGEESQDIIEFLGVDLGVDLNEGEDTTQTVSQALNSGSVAGALNNPDSFMSYLNNASMLEDLTDTEKMEVYKKAASDMVGEMNYDEFIQQPDKVMPYLAAGLSLINSGEKDEDWGAALGKAFVSGYGAKRKEEQDYQKTKAAIGIRKQENVNNLVSQFVMLDYKNKVALNKSLMEGELEKPLMIDISDNGTYTDKQTIPMSEATYAYYAKKFPENFRESENTNKEAWTIVDKTGGLVNVLYDQDEVNNWDPMKNDGAILRKGHDEATNVLTYYREDAEGNKLNDKMLSPKQAEYETNSLGYKLTPASTSGIMKWVIDKDTGEGVYVSQRELQKDPTKYKDDGGMSIVLDSDGNMTYSSGSAGMARTREKAGRDAYEETIESLGGVQQAYTNYFVASLEQDKLIREFIAANPESIDVPFNNLAGRSLSALAKLKTGFTGLGAVFSKPYNEGGYKFSMVNDNGDSREVNFNEFKNSVFESEAFKSALKSPFAKFLDDIGVASEGIKNTMFDLAMVGAATYGPQKGGGLDMRAMSDKDVEFQMGVQGGNAYSLATFLDTRNRFARNLIKKNKNFIKQATRPSQLARLIDENGKVNETFEEAILGDAEQYLKELDEYEKNYSDSYTFGVIGEANNSMPTYIVGEKDLDEDNPNIVELNVSVSPETGVLINGVNAPQFQNVVERYGITSPIDSNTNTVNGSFRTMTEKYVNLGKTNQTKQNEYYQMLQKTLSESEFAILNMHILTVQNQGR